MGKELAAAYAVARHTFEEADEALGISTAEAIFDGTEEGLNSTELTQPAILAVSIAGLRVLKQERPDLQATYFAGHSLGEWSGLVAAGALEFADAVRLVQERGRLMQLAVPRNEGAMVAVLGVDPGPVAAICREVREATGRVVAPAGFNSPEQTVISGHADAVAQATEKLREQGAKRVTPLPVSAPFHCSLMRPAAEGLRQRLGPVDIRPLSAPVITNVEASPNTDPRRVAPLLVAQVTAPVRWVESMRFLVEKGETTCIEIGPCKVLNGLAKRIDRSLKVLNLEDTESLAKTLAALEGA